MALFETELLPFILLNFDDLIFQEFALNVTMMSDEVRERWLNDQNRNLMRIFLVEAETGTLIGLRIFNIELMPDVKRICRAQQPYDSSEIVSFIRAAESMHTVREMYNFAHKREVIPKSEISV